MSFNLVLPVEFLYVLVGVHLRAIGGLVKEELTDDAAVVDVVLAVHRDGARAGATAHHAGERFVENMTKCYIQRHKVDILHAPKTLTVRPSSVSNKQDRAPFPRCSGAVPPRTGLSMRRCHCTNRVR